jgi:hypothetical protein
MAGFRIEGNTSGNVAEVNDTNQILVAMGDDSTKNGELSISSRSDAGLITGVVLDIPPESDQDYRQRVAQDRLEFWETWAGAALNSACWSSTVTTAATAVASAELALNSASSTAANAVARVTSYRTFAMPSPGVLAADFTLRVLTSDPGVLNTTWEVGFFIASGTTAPTDGVFLRMSAVGELRLVVNFNGTETQSGVIDYAATPTGWSSALLPINEARGVILTMHDDAARLWIEDALVAEVESPTSTPMPTQSQALPFNVRIYNGAVAPATATQLRIGPVSISMGGLGVNVASVAESATLAGGGGYQGQSGATMGSTANWANSAAPAAASLSNTAAGYATLGGQFSFAAPAGAETDFALFAYQVPAAAAGSHNRNLIIHGVRVDAVNIGAAVATTATVLQWAIGVGSTAVSLATAEAATTRAPRRVALGVQSWIVGSAIGAPVEAIRHTFRGGLLAEAGSFVHIMVKVPVGTATASQVIRGTVSIDASWV